MIVAWISAVVAWLLKLVIPPKPWQRELVIDPNTRCPYCGHRSGAIFAVPGARTQEAKVGHRCNVCRGEWQEDPVVKVLEDLLARR